MDTPPIWTEAALWEKTKLYVARADDEEQDGSLFPFWSILALELLARTALASVNPVLLADPQSGEHLLYALGYGSPKRPRSVPAATVFRRCAVVIEDFTESDAAGTQGLIDLRNEELHSGGSPFEGLHTGVWLADYFRLCQLLLRFLNRELADLFGPEQAEAGQRMIEAAAEELLHEVQEEIAEKRRQFLALDEADREEKSEGGRGWAHARWNGDRHLPTASQIVSCPACHTDALVTGEYIRSGPPRAAEDAIERDIVKLPTELRCFACDLTLAGHGRLHAAGLGGLFTVVIAEDPASFYGIEFEPTEEDLREFFEPDYGND
jgi:hypothetical protein